MRIFKELKMEINGRKVEASVTNVCSWDYPDFCDAYFCDAVFVDTGEELTDKQYEELHENYPDVLWEMAYQSLH